MVGVALNSEQRKLASTTFDKYADAVAMLNNNVFSRLIFRLVQLFDSPTYPMKLFANKEDAEKWLNSLKNKRKAVS